MFGSLRFSLISDNFKELDCKEGAPGGAVG